MKPELITFQKFNDIALAYQLTDLLKQHDIEFVLEEVPITFDPAFRMKDPDTKEYELKIKATDFVKVNEFLTAEAEQNAQQADPDHYLFNFTDEELIDVLAKRDEWIADDVVLARKILADRGVKVTDEDVASLDQHRMETLRKPAASQRIWIIIGYISALIGGVLGIFIGWHLSTQKKTLPDGERVYEYNENDRQHAKVILWGSVISTAVFVVVKILRMYDGD